MTVGGKQIRLNFTAVGPHWHTKQNTNIQSNYDYPCLTLTQSSGYSSSGVMIISNTFNGDVFTT